MTDTPSRDETLKGRRILVVEDEALVTFMIEDCLEELGCEVVGPAARVEEAISLAATEMADAALLDVNLGGSDASPVARKLAELGIPFGFVTGYGASYDMGEYRDRPKLGKPFTLAEFQRLLKAILSRRRAPS